MTLFDTVCRDVMLHGEKVYVDCGLLQWLLSLNFFHYDMQQFEVRNIIKVNE